MGAVIKYTMQEKKTLWEGRKLVSGINCRPESVYDDFLRTKLLYHKEGGTMYYHMVQSFPTGEEVDPAAAHAAALKLARWFRGREVLVCTHVDRDHIHSHLLINSVSFEAGKKLHISEPELTQLRQRNMQRPTPVQVQHPTPEEWAELTSALTAMGELMAEQILLLEGISARPRPWATQEQTAELIREMKAIRQLAEQAGKKKERHFSLPKLYLPRPSLEWLLVPAVLLGLLALWYGWATLSNGLRVMLP